MSNAAIYARVSSARQKKQETIGSQTAALRAHAEQLGLDVPEQWVFEDDGHSGATLVRPALERLRDLVCQVPVDVLLVYSPDRLARKYAYQALLIEEFAKAGTTVMFVKGPRSDSPEDAAAGAVPGHDRRVREGADPGTVPAAARPTAPRPASINVLSGAPFGYRYVRKSEHAEARYEIVAHEAAIVAELFAPLRRRWGRDRRAGPLAERAGRADPHRQAALGPLHGLGHAAQPRLRRAGLLRQDDAHRCRPPG